MTAGGPRTVAALWQAAAAAGRDGSAYLVDEGGAWREVSWAEAASRVEELAHGFAALGVSRGDRFALLSRTRLEWALVDFALCALGVVVVPIYPTSSANEVAYILENSGARGIVVEDEARLAEIEGLRGRLPGLEWVESVSGLDELAARGREHAGAQPGAVEALARSVAEDDLFTIIYTSGTTGPPKGCLLTNRAYFAMAEAVAGLPGFVRPGDRTVLFLPLAHSFGRLVHVVAARVGLTIAFCPDVADLGRALEQVRPDFLPGVPRVYEKLHAGVQAKLDGARGARGALVRWALGVGRRASLLRQEGRPLPALLELQHGVADRLVYSKVKARLGGRLRFGISGGAPLAPEIAGFFHALDLVVLEGYGLSECTTAAVNLLGRFRFGTVGRPLPGIEVRFAEDGEILLRGEALFSSYHENEAATREAFTDDGWFRTGDIGELDGEGFLRITDRKKDLIATAGCKKVAPQNLEGALKAASKLISNALVVGDRRPYIAALVTLDEEELAGWARAHGLDGGLADLAARPEVAALVREAVDAANRDLSRPEQIKRFAILPRDFSADEGEITPTLKLKRRVCAEHFADEVEQLYARAEE